MTRLKQEMASEINIQQAVASLKQKKKILEEKVILNYHLFSFSPCLIVWSMLIYHLFEFKRDL